MTYSEEQPPIPPDEPVCVNCAYFAHTLRRYGSGVCSQHKRGNAALVVEQAHHCTRFKLKGVPTHDSNGDGHK